MPTLFDSTEIIAELAALRQENETPLVLTREGVALPAQNARIAGKGGGALNDGVTVTSGLQPIAVLFGPDADVQPQDTFSYEGQYFRVLTIRPHSWLGTRVDAERYD